MDELDTALLRLLQNDARRTNREMAAELGIAPSTCLERIRGLRERGVIRGYHAEVDLAAIDRSTQAIVSIKLRPQALAGAPAFWDFVNKLPQTLALFMVSGAADFLVHVAVRDTGDLRDFILDLAKRPEIGDIRSSVALRTPPPDRGDAAALTCRPCPAAPGSPASTPSSSSQRWFGAVSSRAATSASPSPSDPTGDVRYAAGDVRGEVLPRSTAKPLQAVGTLVAGADLDAEQTAIAGGSHTGQDLHVAVIARTLAAAGLTAEALGCPSDWPEDEPTRFRLIASGGGPERILMNCSGKHAAMLAATVATGNDPSDYLAADAPVQQVVRAELGRLTDSTIEVATIDGCGTPLFGVSLTGLALAFGRLVTAAPGTPERRVADAMRNHPDLVGGTGHLNSEVIRLLPGALAKGGAEGVMAMAAPDGHAVAVKVIDGNPRATTAIALTLLQKCGVDVTPATHLLTIPLKGGDEVVGSITPTL